MYPLFGHPSLSPPVGGDLWRRHVQTDILKMLAFVIHLVQTYAKSSQRSFVCHTQESIYLMRLSTA